MKQARIVALFLLAALSISTACILGFQSVRDERYVVIAIGQEIGELRVKTTGAQVDIDFRVDDNGRGPKHKESIKLDAAGLPIHWQIEGTGWFGAPVKETFEYVSGRARWKSLDDAGDASTKAPLYLPNNSSPWTLGLLLRTLQASPGQSRSVLPGGVLRLEKIRDIKIGTTLVTAYAIWGIETAPIFVLGSKGRFLGLIDAAYVVVPPELAKNSSQIQKLAADLSSEVLTRLTATLKHDYPNVVTIQNVHVFDSATGQVGPMTSVVVYDGVIASVRADAPPDGVSIDGGGGTLLPGLHDMHAHIGGGWYALRHIAAGVTSTLDPGNDNEALLELTHKIERAELIGPRVQRAGFLEGKSPFSARAGFVVDNVEDALAKVRWYADRGYRQIKIYNSMNPDFVKPVAAEAHRLGLRVSGHVPAFMTAERAVRDGYDVINHINQLALSWVIKPEEDTRTPFRFTALGERLAGLDLKSEAVTSMLKLMKESGTTLDPTLAVFQALLLSRPGTTAPNDVQWLDHMPISVQRVRRQAALDIKPDQYSTYEASYKKLQEIIVLLHREGIRLIPGTDDEPGMMLHSELEAWVDAGIPASDVLRAATKGSAQFLGTDQSVGSIEPGKISDLILIEGDPTKDISAIRKIKLVMKGNTIYFPDDIHRALGIKPFAEHAKIAR